MSKTFVWSDPHFAHANIIKYCNRPFSSVDEMNETLIANYNNVVGDTDTVICNGDFAFSKFPEVYFDRLKGIKILIKGNHDYGSTLKLNWESVHDILDFTHNKKHIVMCHYPIWSWNRKFHGSIHLYGHVHDLDSDFKDIKNMYNICVERTNYTPVNLDDIIEGKFQVG